MYENTRYVKHTIYRKRTRESNLQISEHKGKIL